VRPAVHFNLILVSDTRFLAFTFAFGYHSFFNVMNVNFLLARLGFLFGF
jgi:hypothetical protein